MNKQIVRTDAAPAPIGPYSQAVAAGNMLFVSGQVPIDPQTNDLVAGDIGTQTTRVMKNIEAILEEAGFGFQHILKTSIFLADMNDFKTVNEVYAGYFESNPPARETVQVSRLPKDARVEISVIALK